MDDYFFEDLVRQCTEVVETTSFLQIFNYSNGETYNDRGALPPSEFDNFLEQKASFSPALFTGVFEPPKTKPGVTVLSGMRLILQINAKQPETFTANHISFTHDEYIRMVRKLRLPFRAIEGTSVVGPFFWSGMDLDDEQPHLHIVYRKSDVRKRGLTRGWELMLSHDMRTGLTTGFAKGTESSQFDRIVEKHLRPCAAHVAHPMLLPALVLGHDVDGSMDEKQRRVRQWLRRLENAISHRNEIELSEWYSDFDLDAMNRELVECHSQVLWKRPQAYLDTLDEMGRALERFREARRQLVQSGRLRLAEAAAAAAVPAREAAVALRKAEAATLNAERAAERTYTESDQKKKAAAVAEARKAQAEAEAEAAAAAAAAAAANELLAREEAALDRLHRGMVSRFDFYRQKLKGAQHYAQTTIARLHIQRDALYNIITQKESKLSLEMAHHQRLLGLAAKRDSQSMKALSVVGAVFLPATYLASLFSMTFFNFQQADSNDDDGDSRPRTVASTLWIYFAITVPLTVVVLLALFVWDRRREKKYAAEARDVATTLPDLERRVMTSLREKRTGLVDAGASWDERTAPVRPGSGPARTGPAGTGPAGTGTTMRWDSI